MRPGLKSAAFNDRIRVGKSSRSQGWGRGATMAVTIFLCGDVMTGRGIDQILPHPSDPVLYEPAVRDARTYVRLAEERTGRLKAPVAFDYIWGDALEVLRRVEPRVRLINLETSVTTSAEQWKGKEIHYRMHPANIGCLASAGVNCCVLSNNHVLDWGYAGLVETLTTLEGAGIAAAGAGRNAEQAAQPVALDAGAGGRVLIFAYGSSTAGVLPEWAATPTRPGVNVLPALPEKAARVVAATIERHARHGDVIIVSVHWGGNWGYTVPREQVDFAHRLIDQAGVDIVHGHSSHHVKGLEVYKGRLILYGCGDFLNDYEGISGYEWYRSELVLMFFATVEVATGALVGLRLAPMQIRHFRLNRAGRDEADWLRSLVKRESKGRGLDVVIQDDGMLTVHWD
jgi:poly-gamma-glutamate synthesis protein (capsule biosynthesis protein)